MYKVLVAEDELLTRAGIVSTVDWNGLDMRLTAQAADGVQAWDFFLEYQPDIVITDLNMPRMDGIQLISKIREEKPECKIIVVTCLNDVQTMKQLLPYHISDYMLKTSITAANLTERLLTAKEELDAEIKQPETVQEKTENERFCEFWQNEDQEFTWKVNEQLLLFRVHTKAPNKFLIMRTVEDFLRDYFAAFSELLVYVSPSLQFTVCFKNVDLDKETIVQRVAKFGDYVYKTLNIALACDLEVCGEASTWKKRQRAYFGYLEHFRQKDSEIAENQAEWFRETAEHLVHLYSFQIYNSEIRSMLGEWLCSPLEELLKDEVINFAEYRSGVIRGLKRFSKAMGLFSDEQLDEVISGIAEKNTFLEVYLEYRKCLDSRKKLLVYPLRNCDEIKKVLDYIEENLEQKITLNAIAESAALSQNYFSVLFKRSMNINFIGYLINYRIYQAMDMLADESAYLYEIAEKVGIPDMPYFSKTFKGITGFAPGEWKKLLGSVK